MLLLVVVVDHILFMILSWWQPKNEIDRAIDFPHKKYAENREKFGDHHFQVKENKKSR